MTAMKRMSPSDWEFVKATIARMSDEELELAQQYHDECIRILANKIVERAKADGDKQSVDKPSA
jgi:hypothetical protein